MEVKIGVQHANRELVIDSSQESDAIEAEVSKALTGDSSVFVLSDSKGRRVIVPVDKLAYVEIGSPTTGQVGFRS